MEQSTTSAEFGCRIHRTRFGATAYSALHDLIAEAKRDDPMAPVVILVPDNLTGITVRRELARGVGERNGVAALTVTTMRRWAEQLLASTARSQRPVTSAIRAAAIRSELAADPGIFGGLATHDATVEALVTALRDIDELSPEHHAEVDREPDELVAKVSDLHRAVGRRIGIGWYTETELVDAATAALTPDALGGARHILFLPGPLPRSERELLARLAELTVVDTLVGHSGDARLDGATLAQLPEETAAPDPVPFSGRPDATRADRADAPAVPGERPSTPAGAPTAGTVFHASDADDEVRSIVREVVSALETTPAHRIAVLYSTPNPYARLLHEHLAAAGIRANGRGIRSVAERAIPAAFLALLDLADADGIPRAAFFAALSRAPLRWRGERTPTASWERDAREAGIVATGWRERLDALGDRMRTRAEGNHEWLANIERRIDRMRSLADMVDDLRRRLDDLASRRDWRDLAVGATELLEAYVDLDAKRLPQDERYAVVALQSAIRASGELGAVESTADLATFRTSLRGQLESAVPRVGRFGEGVFVGPIRDGVGLLVDRAFVVGLSEDLYPGRSRPDALLPDTIRARLAPDLETARDRIDRAHRDLLAVIGATPDVTLSFPRGDLRQNTPRIPSRWLLPTLRALSGDDAAVATEWQRAESPRIRSSDSNWRSIRGTDAPATPQEWRLRAIAAGEPDRDELRDATLAMIDERASDRFTRFDGNLTGAELEDLRASKWAIAPTTLEGYASCPHAHFVGRMLGARPLDNPDEIVQISPMEIGNLIHNSIEQLVDEFEGDLPANGAPWTEAQRERLRAIGEERAADLERRGLTGHPLLWARERGPILLDLERVLDIDDAFRAGNMGTVVASEFWFGGEDAVVVPVEGGEVHFLGSIDLIERAADGRLFVVDIKTGSRSGFAAIEKEDPIVGGTKLQLPVYARAAQREYGAERVVAQYWFVRRDPAKPVEVALDTATDARFREGVGTLVGSMARGMYMAKPPEGEDFLWVQCPYCSPDGLGYGELRTRYKRKRPDPVAATLLDLIDPLPEATPAGGDA